MKKMLLNVILYQLVWLLCVLWGDSGAVLALPLLFLHLWLSPNRRADIELMISLYFVGVFIDGGLFLLGFFTFKSAVLPIPAWLVMIWLSLATLPNNSLAWMKSRYLLCLFFGAIGGPLAYWAGVRLGAAAFGLPLLPSLLILAGVWGLLWPLVMCLSSLLADRNVPVRERPYSCLGGR